MTIPAIAKIQSDPKVYADGSASRCRPQSSRVSSRRGPWCRFPTLAAQFDVSATPVREAMLDLAQRGFVEPVRNKGFRVTTVSLDELREIIEIRQLLEAPAMRTLAGQLSTEDLAPLRDLAADIAHNADNGKLTAFIETDREFHLGLLELHGNARLVGMVRELRSQTRMVNLSKMTDSPELAQAAREHHEMLDLIESGEGERLEELTVRHLAHVVAWWGEPQN